MKKIFAATLAVALVFGATAAFAQTIAVSADPDGPGPLGLTQVFDAPAGLTFDLVVWMDTAGVETNAAEFVMTELRVVAPGVLSTATVKFNNALDLGLNSVGEYLLAFGACFPPATQMEMVRVTYLQLAAGTIVADQLITLRGFQPGDTRPSTFAGEPGFVDCSEGKHPLVLGGADGGTTGADVVFPDGTLILNPTPLVVPTVDNSMGQLKAHF
jgi:hypothetical protein